VGHTEEELRPSWCAVLCDDKRACRRSGIPVCSSEPMLAGEPFEGCLTALTNQRCHFLNNLLIECAFAGGF